MANMVIDAPTSELPYGVEIVNTAKGEPLDEVKVKEITQRLIDTAAEFISSQQEVTLVVPLIGGIALNAELVQTLIDQKYPVENLNIIFCESRGHEEEKEFFFDSTQVRGTVVMMDDTVDKVGTMVKIGNILSQENRDYHGMVVFVPVVKTPTLGLLDEKNIPYISLSQSGNEKAKGRKNVLKFLSESNGQSVVVLSEEINPDWINAGFGMHGDSLERIRKGELDMKVNDAAYYDALQRVSAVCLKKDPDDIEYEIEYLSWHSRVEHPTKSSLVENLRILSLFKDAWIRGGDSGVVRAELSHARNFFDAIIQGNVRIDFN